MGKAVAPLSPQEESAVYWGGAAGIAGILGYPVAAIVAGAVAAWLLTFRPRPLSPTHEDLSTGFYVTGVPRSGKTAFAYLKAREFCDKGFGWVWLSIKSSLPLLEFLPAAVKDEVLVFNPLSSNPLGFNFLRLYTNSPMERELLADQTAELFTRLHSAMSANMKELIKMGCLALLTWAQRERTEVTLHELYEFFQRPAFQQMVLATTHKAIRDAFGSDEVSKQTMTAVRRQLRRSVTYQALLVALSQTNGIDLWSIMRDGRHLLCETPEGELGPDLSAFLCRVVASRLQMLTARRPAGSLPFVIFADEFQRYTSPTFAKGIETAGEYRVVWFLIHQTNAGQDLGESVHGAVEMCGNQVYFRQTHKDARRAAQVFAGQWEAEMFPFLRKRHFKALTMIRGEPVVSEGVTRNLPTPDRELAAYIIRRNESGPTRQQILTAIDERKVWRRVGRSDGAE